MRISVPSVRVFVLTSTRRPLGVAPGVGRRAFMLPLCAPCQAQQSSAHLLPSASRMRDYVATCRAALQHYQCAGCAVPAASWRWSAACTRCAGSRVCRSCEGKPYYCGHCSAQASGCAAAWWALSPEYRRHPPTEGYARVLSTGLTHGGDSARVGLNGTRLTPCRA